MTRTHISNTTLRETDATISLVEIYKNLNHTKIKCINYIETKNVLILLQNLFALLLHLFCVLMLSMQSSIEIKNV